METKITTISQLQTILKSNKFSHKFYSWFALDCAKYTLSKIKKPDPRILKCIETTELYLNNKITIEELVEARYAATATNATNAANAAVYYANAAAAAAYANAAYATYAATYATSAAGEKEVIMIFVKHYDRLSDLEKTVYDLR